MLVSSCDFAGRNTLNASHGHVPVADRSGLSGIRAVRMRPRSALWNVVRSSYRNLARATTCHVWIDDRVALS